MRKQFKKKYNEVRDIATRYDEELLRLLKLGHRELIAKLVKDYLQQHES